MLAHASRGLSAIAVLLVTDNSWKDVVYTLCSLVSMLLYCRRSQGLLPRAAWASVH